MQSDKSKCSKYLLYFHDYSVASPEPKSGIKQDIFTQPASWHGPSVCLSVSGIF